MFQAEVGWYLVPHGFLCSYSQFPIVDQDARSSMALGNAGLDFMVRRFNIYQNHIINPESIYKFNEMVFYNGIATVRLTS